MNWITSTSRRLKTWSLLLITIVVVVVFVVVVVALQRCSGGEESRSLITRTLTEESLARASSPPAGSNNHESAINTSSSSPPSPFSSPPSPFSSPPSFLALSPSLHSIRRRSVRKSANVGESVVLDCDINHPQHPMLGNQLTSKQLTSQQLTSYQLSTYQRQQTQSQQQLQQQQLQQQHGSTEHIIKWHKQGVEVPIYIQLNRLAPHVDARYKGRVKLTNHGGASLEISHLMVSDEGWYECSVVFLNKLDDIHPNGTWVHLTITAPPTLISTSPGLLIQKVGSNVELSCSATGIPPATLTWLKDGLEVVSQGRRLVTGNTIHIRRLEKTDAGVYVCLFTNNVGTVQHKMKLLLEQNVYIMVAPKNVTSIEGSHVRLTCQAEAVPNNVTYQWSRDDVDIRHIAELISRGTAEIHSDGSLVFNSVHRDDTGWYTCSPTNGIGQAPTARAFLNVTYAPVVRDEALSSVVYLLVDLPSRIVCPTDANPAPTHFVWTKNNQEIKISSNYQHDHRLLASDRHYYQQKQQQQQQRQQQRLQEQQPQQQQYSLDHDGSLVISLVTASDSGQYTCTPYSTLGPGHTSPPIKVLVREAPHFTSRPRPIYQRNPTQSVSMPCEAEGDPKPTTTWRKSDGLMPARTKLMYSGASNLTIVHLMKEDEGLYECVATNTVTTVITTTHIIIELVAQHPPYNLSARTTSTSVKVSWLPAYDSAHPLHYVLWYKLTEQEEEEEEEEEEGERGEEWEEVVEEGEYGEGGENSEEEEGVDGSSSSGREEEEKVGGREVWVTLRVVPPDVTSVTVHDLIPGRTYQFFISARNRLGQTQDSPTIIVNTKRQSMLDGEDYDDETYFEYDDEEEEEEEDEEEDETNSVDIEEIGSTVISHLMSEPRPSPPLNVTVRPQKDGLHITWLKPRDSPISVDYYQIEYRTVAGWVPLDGKVEKTWFTWKTASFGATYQFRVFCFSKTSSVASESSPIVTVNARDPMVTLPMSDSMIGAVVGLVVFLLLSLLLILLSLHLYKTRRRQQRRMNGGCGGIKYARPNQVELTTADRRNGNGGPAIHSFAAPTVNSAAAAAAAAAAISPTSVESQRINDFHLLTDGNHVTSLPNHYERKIVHETPI